MLLKYRRSASSSLPCQTQGFRAQQHEEIEQCKSILSAINVKKANTCSHNVDTVRIPGARSHVGNKAKVTNIVPSEVLMPLSLDTYSDQHQPPMNNKSSPR